VAAQITLNRKLADGLYRESFGAFAYAAYSVVNSHESLLENWHIDCLCYRLELMARFHNGEPLPANFSERDLKRLVINLPPRSLKSYIVSVAWIAWLFGRDPSLEIICASYAEDLAKKFSRDCRRLMESKFYNRIFPSTRINPRKSTETEFEIVGGGCRVATSVGGTLTGRGAHVLIVDDPSKAGDVTSETALQSANEWFQNTALSRLNNQKSIVLVVQQRIHADDLSGILLESDWPGLIMPAIAVEGAEYLTGDGQTYHRSEGELLQVSRDSLQALEETKRSIGSKTFSAQYQQNPTPPAGNMIKPAWIGRYKSSRDRQHFDAVVLCCDPAGKAGPTNDYTAIAAIGIAEKCFHLLEVGRGHWTVLEMEFHIRSWADRWDPSHVLVEDTSTGMGLIQLLREKTHLPVIGRRPKFSKEARLTQHQGHFEAGRVILPVEASWLAEFEAELLAFPNGRHDDQVDALLLFLDWFFESGQHLMPPKFVMPFFFSWPSCIPGS
jgi:predicted phage terminase large subunit-like protein